MIKTCSRLIKFKDKIVCYPGTQTPKNGSEYLRAPGFGYPMIGFVIYWKDGKIHNDDGPAIEFDDAHTEYWQHGVPHNDQKNSNGILLPAIISDYMSTLEYWIHGKQVPNPNL